MPSTAQLRASLALSPSFRLSASASASELDAFILWVASLPRSSDLQRLREALDRPIVLTTAAVADAQVGQTGARSTRSVVDRRRQVCVSGAKVAVAEGLSRPFANLVGNCLVGSCERLSIGKLAASFVRLRELLNCSLEPPKEAIGVAEANMRVDHNV
eukprot:2993263-Prymnesium_polylepis.2